MKQEKIRKTKFQVYDYVRAKENTKITWGVKNISIWFKGVAQITKITPIGISPVLYELDRTPFAYRAPQLAHVTKQKALEYKLCQ